MSELRIAVLGVGVMGADYVARITSRISGPLIQVGFMRRFDHEYAQLKTVIDRGELGQPLVMHCVHRNPAVPPSFDSAMTVRDSLVHEVDVTRAALEPHRNPDPYQRHRRGRLRRTGPRRSQGALFRRMVQVDRRLPSRTARTSPQRD